MSAGRRAAGCATLRSRGRGEVRSDAVFLDRRAWIWELDVFGVGGGAVGGWDVRYEHSGERRRVSARELWNGKVGLVEMRLSLVGSACDFDQCAVHVHLTIADLVEPGPRESVGPRSDACRDRITVRIRVGRGGGIVCSDVTSDVFRGTASLDRVDDHPFGALCCRGVGGKRDLA